MKNRTMKFITWQFFLTTLQSSIKVFNLSHRLPLGLAQKTTFTSPTLKSNK